MQNILKLVLELVLKCIFVHKPAHNYCSAAFTVIVCTLLAACVKVKAQYIAMLDPMAQLTLLSLISSWVSLLA